MEATADLFFSIREIHLIHHYTLFPHQRSDYRRGRGQYGFVFGLKGEAEYRFTDGKRQTVKAGELIVLSKDAAYLLTVKESFEHITANFSLREEESRLPFSRDNYLFHSPRKREEFQRMLEESAHLLGTKPAGFLNACHSRLYAVTALLCEELSSASSPLSPVSRAKNYLQENYHLPFPITRLAELCGMSLSHFRREYRRIYGEAPLQTRDRLRLLRAKQELLNGGLSVGEIALLCGFEDESYFCRFFRKKTGLSPTAYRKQTIIV